MHNTHFSVYYLYTFFLFLTVSYFVYLKFFYFTKYADLITKVTTNLTTYLLILYLAAFALSLAISITFHSASLIGEALAWYVVNELDFEKLKATREIQNYPPPGEWVSLDKQRADPMNQSEGKINSPTVTVKGERSEESGNHSTGKQEPHSPSEGKKSLIGRISNNFFSDLRQKGQQKIAFQAAGFVKEGVVKSGMEPENKNIALLVVDNLSDPTKAIPASEIGVPDLEKNGVEPVVITYTCKMEDGSAIKYHCAHTIRALKLYNLCDGIANGKPKFNWAEQQVVVINGKMAGHNQLVCVSERSISFPNNSNAENYPG